MGTPTYTPIATTTLTSSASSVTFSSIPATYRDLVLVFNAFRAAGSSAAVVRVNGDTGSNYFNVRAGGDGSSTASSIFNTSFFSATQLGQTGTVPGTTIFNFLDYSTTNKHKNVLARVSIAESNASMAACRWGNTAAINQIQVLTVGNPAWDAGSTFSLYGIEA
jgi:hypothetical protein